VFKRYIKWLLQDGLFAQTYFGICAVIFLALGGGIILAVIQMIADQYSLLLSLILFAFGLLFIYTSVIWGAVCLLHPTTKLAKIGLKMLPDSADVLFLIIVPILFLVVATVVTFLRRIGVRGYPLSYYKKLVS
jgi:hypothetical protein